MAREAVKVELYGNNNDGDQRRFTCANATGITKGTILKFADPRTASASTGTADIVAGIAAMDKVANDGSTSISVWTNGIFELYASGAIAVGANVVTAAPGNYVKAVTDETASFAIVVGHALEAASDGEVINVRVII